jgi:hypothetical protein
MNSETHLPPPPPPSVQQNTRIVFAAGVPPEFIRRMIDVESEKFERRVLVLLLRNLAFVDQIAAVLCVNPCREETAALSTNRGMTSAAMLPMPCTPAC